MSGGRTSNALAELEVWFLTGSQTLYGDVILRQVAEDSRQLAATLDDSSSIPVRIVSRPVLTEPGEIRRQILAANSSDTCVGVIAWMHTFSPAKMWIGGLSVLQKPLLHLHTQFNRNLPWQQIDMEYMNLHQSSHGDREFGHLLTRLQIARKTVAGHVSDPVVAERIGTWSRAACGWHESQSLCVARFGDNMRDVAVTEGDKVEAQIRFGFSVRGYGVGDLAEAVREVTQPQVDDLVSEYEHSYDLVPELQASGERRASLEEAARIEAGLRSFLDDRGCKAFTDTFEDLHGLPQLPGIAAQRLMADGFGFGAEGDWKSAALVRILKVMATGLPGGTSLMEDYTYDLAPDKPRVLGAHMLEICPSIADGRPSCEIHPLAIGGRDDPVRLVFNAAAGPAVVLGLVDLGSRFRLIANEVDVVSPPQELPKLPVARAVWEPRPDFTTALEAWLVAGGPHHTAFTAAVGVEAIADLSAIAGVELVSIDGRTRPREVERELHWNRAYYGLPQGL